MSVVSIVFVDDHPILLSGLGHLFDLDPDFKVLGFGTNAGDAVDMADRLAPDLIVLDLNMPGKILDAMRTISVRSPRTRMLVFTAVTNVDLAASALEAGAQGYVLKGSGVDELFDAIHAVNAGETFISPGFASKLVAGIRTSNMRRTKTEALRLNSREEQIMRLLLRGATNREIAQALAISDKTVKHYMTTLMQRLNVRNRIEVVLAAQEMGLGTPGQERPLLN